MIGLKTRLENSSEEMLKELQSFPQINCIVHLAAMTLVKDCQSQPEKAYALNVEGASKWFMAAHQAGIRHFILASTSHVYGNPHTEQPISTKHPLNPVSVYGQTKVAAEIQLSDLARNFPQMKLTIARLFSVISKESKPGLLYTNLHRRAREKDFSPIPGLHYVRDFIPVDDVVDRLIRLASWQNAPPIVHISSGKGRRVLDLAAEVFLEYGLDAQKLLNEAPQEPNDIPWIVGEPTIIPDS